MQDGKNERELPKSKSNRDQNRINENIPRDPGRAEREILESIGLGDDDDED